LRWLIVASTTIELLAGCVGNVGHWQTTPDDEAFMNMLFALLAPCCAKNGLDPSMREDEWKTSLRSNGFTRDQSLRSACLQELQSIAGTPNCAPMLGDIDDPCVRALAETSGPALAGQSCASTADCAGSPGAFTVCLQTVPSSCAVLTRGKLGSHPCVGQSRAKGLVLIPSDTAVPAGAVACDVGAGLYCDASSKSCAALLADGSPCADSDACASRTCLTDTQTCAPVVSLGASCAPAVCDESARCDSLSRTCVARLADGSPCLESDDCVGTCVASACSPVTKAEISLLEGWCI
jgi:hypothetical protein